MMKIEFERNNVYMIREREENGVVKYVTPEFPADIQSVQCIPLTAKEAAQMIQELRTAYIVLEKKAERMEAVIIEDIAKRAGKCKDDGRIPPKPVGPPNQRISDSGKVRRCEHDERH